MNAGNQNSGADPTQGLCLPNHLEIGQAVANGSCFFDSFRQGLEQLGIKVTIAYLRTICKEFAENNPPDWFVNAISNSHQHNGVRTETLPQYIENIKKNQRWGDPDVEGRILCMHYNVSFYVIEKQQTQNIEIYIYQLVDASGCKCITDVDFNKQNTLYIINQGQGHFEPILRKVAPQNINQNVTIKNMDEIKKQLAVQTFNKFEAAIKNGDVGLLEKLIKYLYRTIDQTLLVNIYADQNNSIRDTHLITLACKYNQTLVLDFLLKKTNILFYLPSQFLLMEQAYTQALCYIMRYCNMNMLNTLYDYWSGDLHWISHEDKSDPNDVITNLQRLNNLLVKARDDCKEFLKHHSQRMLHNINCLIYSNEFQVELYKSLSKLKTKKMQHASERDKRIHETETIKQVLLVALNLYEEYSNKQVYLDTEMNCKQGFCYMCFLMSEVYYRKIDYNIVLIFVNNIHLLKLRLNLPTDKYQEIECIIYYFLYCVNNNWSAYLPENTPKYENLTNDIKHELYYYESGPVIYEEWANYTQSLKKFKTLLENTDVEANLREVDTQLPEEEINSLTLLPCLRDEYSLRKILQYIEQISYVDFKQNKKQSVLIVQRIIQMTGELLKSTPKSLHLTRVILDLLLINIPNKTYSTICNLRDIISHARDGQMIRRIELEQIDDVAFELVAKDIEQLKKIIIDTLEIYSPNLEKILIWSGLHLIKHMFTEMPSVSKSSRKEIVKRFIYGLKYENDHTKFNSWVDNYVLKYPKLTTSAVKKIAHVGLTSIKLNNRVKNLVKEIKILLTKNLPIYKKAIMEIISQIEEQNMSWECIKQDCIRLNLPSADILLDYPNSSCISKVKSELRSSGQSKTFIFDMMKQLKDLQDLTTEWNQIINIITKFIIPQGSFTEKSKHRSISSLCKEIETSVPDKAGIKNVRQFVEYVSQYCLNYQNNNNLTTQGNVQEQPYQWTGLQALEDKMCTNHFLTTTELNYLDINTKNVCSCNTAKVCNHSKIFIKILKNTLLNEKEYQIIATLNINDRCKKIIRNLVNGFKRDNNYLECLVERTNFLTSVLEGNRDPNTIVLRFKHEPQFRTAIEMVLSDIMNIYEHGWLKELANSNYTKLLAEYPLRNILSHGNPLLDICGVTLDDIDYANALVTFTLKAVNDEPQLNSLLKLYEDGVLRGDVKLDKSANLNDIQQKLVDHFKTCTNAVTYMKLLPKDFKEPVTKIQQSRKKSQTTSTRTLAKP